MPHNPPPAQGDELLLPEHRVLVFAGRDAIAFAHAQFMNDVAALPIGNWQWNGWLTPKGRVIALFALIKRDDQTLWLLLPDADPRELAAALQRFVFRSKLAIEVREDLVVSGSFSPPVRASQARVSVVGDGIELDMGADGGPRGVRIGAGIGSATDGSGHWAAFDLEHGLPRLPPAQAGHWTPQQLSLDRLHAYSVRKGCYPGQEIVARTHFLGQAKRGLTLLEANAPLAPGAEVGDGTHVIGTLVSVATNHTGTTALAVLPLERDMASTLSAGNIALRERKLLTGLAR
jgi:folate-binding protein YgfZ